MRTSSVYIDSLWIAKYRNICVLNLVLICILYSFIAARSHFIVTLCRKTDFWISALLIIQCVKYGLFLPLFIIKLEISKLSLFSFIVIFWSYFLGRVRHTKCNIKISGSRDGTILWVCVFSSISVYSFASSVHVTPAKSSNKSSFVTLLVARPLPCLL